MYSNAYVSKLWPANVVPKSFTCTTCSNNPIKQDDYGRKYYVSHYLAVLPALRFMALLISFISSAMSESFSESDPLTDSLCRFCYQKHEGELRKGSFSDVTIQDYGQCHSRRTWSSLKFGSSSHRDNALLFESTKPKEQRNEISYCFVPLLSFVLVLFTFRIFFSILSLFPSSYTSVYTLHFFTLHSTSLYCSFHALTAILVFHNKFKWDYVRNKRIYRDPHAWVSQCVTK